MSGPLPGLFARRTPGVVGIGDDISDHIVCALLGQPAGVVFRHLIADQVGEFASVPATPYLIKCRTRKRRPFVPTQVAVMTGVPVGFGVLTCDDDQQALDRAGLPGSREDKGHEAATAAVATAVVLRGAALPADRPGRDSTA